MPPPLLERLALELFRVVLLLILVVFEFGAVQADDLELQAQQLAELRFDRAHVDWAQHHEHINEFKPVQLARRLRIDWPFHVRRAFGQLSPMLNAGLARRPDFTRQP
jgi:hypothetical protein